MYFDLKSDYVEVKLQTGKVYKFVICSSQTQSKSLESYNLPCISWTTVMDSIAQLIYSVTYQ